MSSSLSWEPPPEESKRHYIGLKYEIGRYLDEDYNGGNDSWTVGNELIPFLKGLMSASPETSTYNDAEELILAIEKYGKVILTIS